MTKQVLPSATIGIPTYYGGPGLVKTVKSILASKNVGQFRLIVTVDGNPLSKSIYAQLKKLGVEILDNKDRRGQMGRIKQLIQLTKTDLLILTQDDIRFAPNTLAHILKAFTRDPKLTMISGKLLPEPASTFIEIVNEMGIRLNYRIGNSWRKGDNYLLASGRLIGLKARLGKKFTLAEEVINSDAYLYFINKEAGGVFRHLPQAVIYNKSPQKINEVLKQSRKFLISHKETSHFLKKDLSTEYTIPKRLMLQATLAEFIQHPCLMSAYLGLFIYTRFPRENPFKKMSRFWDTDLSTKRVS